MFRNDYKRIYHFHLKKCGGTTLNAWLDQQATDTRSTPDTYLRHQRNFVLNEATDQMTFEDFEQSLVAEARVAGIGYDVIHSHVSLNRYLAKDCYKITILRNPVDRLLSQVADWRRLTEADYAGVPERIARAMADCRTMPLREFLETHGSSTFPFLFDNYLTRALASVRTGLAAYRTNDFDALLDAASIALRSDFDSVGIMERQMDACRVVASDLGLCPPREMEILNKTGSRAALADEIADASEILQSLTRMDQKVYALAETMFARSWRNFVAVTGRAGRSGKMAGEVASQAVARLHPTMEAGMAVFSVRNPIVGAGFHARDAARLPNCRVWTGPGLVSILYMPTPAGVQLVLRIWINGYADEALRDGMKVVVNGRAVDHRFATAEGYRDVVEAELDSSHGFASIELQLDATVAGDRRDGIMNGAGTDIRRRGVSFDRYGWRLAEAAAR